MYENNCETNVAIVGMAGKFPKADNIEEYWNNLIKGIDCISRRDVVSENNIVYAYGAIDKPYHFDNEFFGITPGKAKEIAPQERILLEISYQALEDAGCIIGEGGKKVGIICGAPENDYRIKLAVAAGLKRGLNDMEYTGSSLASRVAYKLNLTGPSIMVTAACATSMIAVHQSCQMLLNYEADVMLAGGTNVYSSQEKYLTLDNLTSSDGYGRAFDDKATGLVPANGTAMVVLKRLDDAIADNDQIYAVIKGSATGNDGNRKIGFTAPSIKGEKEVIEEAMLYADVIKSDIDFIETHGTGTKLGDAIELRALKEIFNNDEINHKIPIGALKNNYGHMNMTAGIAGVIKVAMSLKNRIVPPIINIENVNEELRDSDMLTLNNTPLNFESNDKPLIAGVSSFGFGGINAHMILEEYQEIGEEQCCEMNQSYILPISAKTERSLVNTMDEYLKWISKNIRLLPRVSNMLFNHRKWHEHRGYIIASQDGIKYLSKRNFCNMETVIDNKDIIYNFIGDIQIDFNRIKQLYMYNRYFKKYYDKCNDVLKECSSSKYDLLNNPYELDRNIVLVSYQYSFANMLRDMNIMPNGVSSDSNGRLSMAAFNGMIDIKESLKLLCDEIVHNKYEDIISKISYEKAEFDVFSTDDLIADDNEIINIDFSNNDDVSGLHFFTSDDIDFAMKKFIGELWIRGCIVSPDEAVDLKDKRKVSLPPYCFDRSYYNVLDGYYPEIVSFELNESDLNYFKEVEQEKDGLDRIKRCRDYEGLNEAYNDMCIKSSLSYFYSRGIEVNRCYKLEEIYSICNVIDTYKPYIKFLIKILKDSNYVYEVDGNYEFNKIVDVDKCNMAFEQYKNKYTEFYEYISLVHKTSANFNDVFSGKIAGNQIIYPNGNFDMLRQIGEKTPPTSLKATYVKIMTDVIKRVVQKSNKRLKILEVGAGTGALTWSLMEALKDENVEYYFTDIGRSFIATAEKQAKKLGYKNMKFKQYNVENECFKEGIGENKFDVVVALDVVQATHNIVDALANIKAALKPKGWMISVQTLWLHNFTQLIYGYAPGWWNYSIDPLRKDKSIYIDYDSWEKAYEFAGYEKVSHITGGYDGNRNEVALVFAMKPDCEVNDDIPISLKGINLSDGQSVKKTYEKQSAIENEPIDIASNLIQLMIEVTGVEEIVCEDDLYSAGIDSLSMLILRSKIKELYKVDITIHDFSICETVSDVINKVKSLITQIDSSENEESRKDENKGKIESKKDINELFKIIKHE